jgi:hypothetical protein
MVFAAADYWLAGVPVPPERSPEVFRHFCRRLIDSWALPFGLLRYYDWQRRPGGSRTVLGVVRPGLIRLTVAEEVPKIAAAIDAGLPAPLGLVKVHSWDPRQMPRNHQILAFGYAIDDSKIELRCYDPNWPSDDVILTVPAGDLDADAPVVHSIEGTTGRGVFHVPYSRSDVALPIREAGAQAPQIRRGLRTRLSLTSPDSPCPSGK